MVRQNQKRRLILLAALLLAALPLSAQQNSGQADSLVRLLNAVSLEQVEKDGRMARKAIDPTFLHNGTYLSCDTALWHVEEKLINCFGNVRLTQGESVLTSGKLDYLIDESLAQFRGGVVELRNQRDNVLRTYTLDYNTQDSLAVFSGGASMISSDGQIIESDEGTYENARDMFNFNGNVNMFTDSIFVRTEQLRYDSKASRADFLTEIDFWKDGRMLSA
ncbi:MAG: OstA-like protein, partial [Bacteroidales bacterium]|nr:OstA-like protein [Bacteroidales bacterium]